MYAIIETGGKQYRVMLGDEITVEKIEGNKGDEVIFERVLMLADEGGVKIGTPVVTGSKVVSEIIRQEKGQKSTSFA